MTSMQKTRSDSPKAEHELISSTLEKDPVISALADHSKKSGAIHVLSSEWDGKFGFPRNGIDCKHSLRITPAHGISVLEDGGQDGNTVDLKYVKPSEKLLGEGVKAGLTASEVQTTADRLALAVLEISAANLSRADIARLLRDKTEGIIPMVELRGTFRDPSVF